MDNISINARSSIRIAGEKVLYFDPFKVAEEKHDADFVFITHDHYDHFSPEDIIKVSKQSTILILPLSTKDKVYTELADKIYKIVFVNPDNDDAEFLTEHIAAKCIRAYNVGKPFHPKDSGWGGYLGTIGETSYFVMGDTDANKDNENVKCDVLLIPCGGKYTFDAKEAAEYTAKIKPGIAIPTHYTDEPGRSGIPMVYQNELQRLDDRIKVEILI